MSDCNISEECKKEIVREAVNVMQGRLDKMASHIDAICNDRFDAVTRSNEAVLSAVWQSEKMAKASLDAINALKDQMAGTIAAEKAVRRGVWWIMWIGDKLGVAGENVAKFGEKLADLGEWAKKTFGVVILVYFLLAAYNGKISWQDIWKFASKAWE